jgi:hypothetical protein
MSLLEDVADQLRTTGEHLPIVEVAAAAERLRMAGGLLARVVHTSTNPAGVPTLAAATERLEHATRAMLVAQRALRDYAVALGLPRYAVPAEYRRWRAAPAPTPRAGRRPELSDWWAERIAEITEGQPRPVSHPAQTSADLLHRCTASALAEDRDRLRRELCTAGPAVGLGLAAITPPLLRFLAAALVGHTPRIEDLATVRRAALPAVGPLLPGAPAGVAEELLARTCHAPPQRNPGSAPHHPVDTAAAGAVLVAALLRATGRSADDLATSVRQPETRRAPAVEALLAVAR